MQKIDFSKIMKYLKIFLVVMFIIFEEIIWNKIGQPIYNKIKTLKIMDRFKVWVSNVKNIYVILVIFLGLFIGMEIVTLLALKAFATGAIVIGIGLYVIKILMVVPVVIIFNEAKKQLVTFLPIRYVYGMVLNFKRSKTFREIKRFIAKLRIELNRFVEEYLDGDEDLLTELKKIYNNIKNI